MDKSGELPCFLVLRKNVRSSLLWLLRFSFCEDNGPMIMNTQQLFYLTEIQRTRSISQAAENLYMSQPNLSRVLRETEESLGFPIFQRTHRGVQPTEKGTAFLRHAKAILREAEFMERLGANYGTPNRLWLAIPRSWQYLALSQSFLSRLSGEEGLDVVIRECHPRQALELLGNSEVEIAIIRYATDYQAYFTEQAQARNLQLQLLDQTRYQLTLSRCSPLVQKAQLRQSDLESFTEILHRDIFHPGMKGRRCVRTTDRLAQLQLLQALTESYCWLEPLPASLLQEWGLVQRPIREGGQLYQNALAFRPQCAMSAPEEAFLDWIQKQGGITHG